MSLMKYRVNMKGDKRLTIGKQFTYSMLTIALVSMILASSISIIFMFQLKNRAETSVISRMEVNIENNMDDKVEIAKMELSKYTDYLRRTISFIDMIYRKPENYVVRSVPKRGPNEPRIPMIQRSFANKNYNIDMVAEELGLLSNLDSIWEPMILREGDVIETIYYGTENGFMLSYDRNANIAEYSEDGEVYFNHLERPWYKEAKKAGDLVYSDLATDFFGRGLTLSCAIPFYRNGILKGVVGVDILVEDLQKDIVDIDIIKNNDEDFAFLVDMEGNIIASPNVKSDTKKFENINDEDNKYYSIRDKILSEESGLTLVDDFYCAYSKIDGPNWILCVDVPREIVLEPVKLLEERIKNLLFIYIALVFVILMIVMLISRNLSRNLSEPIVLLQKDVEIISGGDLDRKVKVIGNDEISDLAEAFNNMTSSLKQYMHDFTKLAVEKERIGAELSVATGIQASMLPSKFPAFPNDNRFDIYAIMNPAKEVGGDFYDFFMVDDKNLAIVVADVSGKGVPAALFMAIGKTLIKDHTYIEKNLKEVFEGTNNSLCESNSEGLFITAFEAIINLETGLMRYVNAGHEIPFIYSDGVGFKALKIEPGFVLAGMENTKYTTGEMVLKHGDKIFQYTDGVPEATNINNELYGMKRLEKVLNANNKLSMKELLAAVKKDIDKFVGEVPQFDDITMLGFEFY